MKLWVKPRSEKKILRDFPIQGLLEGWFFRQQEISAGVYEVAGTDCWGRGVSETGTDPEILLAQCVDHARKIKQQLPDRKAIARRP